MLIKKNKNVVQKKYKQILARWALSLIGWKVVGEVPQSPKYVMVGYPHTSNWDVPIGLLIYTSLGVRLHWVGKHTLFKKPIGWFIRLLGGIPVNREKTINFVQQLIDIFNESKELVLTVSPEGTRSTGKFWRTGFYYIAQGAGVPIATGFLDYANKSGGFGPLVEPSGDIESDFNIFKNFYSNIKGKFPDDMGEIRLKLD